MKNYNKEIGRYGEEKATEYLLKNGYKIIKRNFDCYFGEIDIIAKDLITKELVFIEVKTRTTTKYGIPAEAVNKQKIVHIEKTIKYFLHKNYIEDEKIRIDIIEIVLADKFYKLNHLKQVV